MCNLLNCAVANNCYRPSSSFQLFLSEKEVYPTFPVLFRTLIETPGELTKDDTADDLE